MAGPKLTGKIVYSPDYNSGDELTHETWEINPDGWLSMSWELLHGIVDHWSTPAKKAEIEQNMESDAKKATQPGTEPPPPEGMTNISGC